MSGSIYAIATMDTKGEELTYVAQRIKTAGAQVVMVDVGTGQPPTVAPEITRETVAAAHPKGASAVLSLTDRGQAVSAMGEALREFLTREQGRGESGGCNRAGRDRGDGPG